MPVTGFRMGKISAARATAFRVLEAVAEGAYASDALRVSAAGLAPRDAGLASQIVLGCLRFQLQLDYLILKYSGRNPTSWDNPVLIALRTAIFQLRYLERIPPHAAVHESVEWVKTRKRSAVALTNAVLRKVNRDPVTWPNASIEFSCPDWLLEGWTAHFGRQQAEQIAKSALLEPQRYIRIAPGYEVPSDLVVEPTPVAGCFRLLSAPPPGIRLHDISSQAIPLMLNLKPGHRYLDLCAAPGNKTLQALETPLGLAIACDISEKRIAGIPPVCQRVILDATCPLPFGCTFDRIFIDAPCSGTGTLARNPEIKWRVHKQDLQRFGKRQRQIISQALQVLAPEGKLLYATCSLEQEENEDIVKGILGAWPDLRCEQAIWRLPGRDLGDGFYAAVLSAGR